MRDMQGVTYHASYAGMRCMLTRRCSTRTIYTCTSRLHFLHACVARAVSVHIAHDDDYLLRMTFKRSCYACMLGEHVMHAWYVQSDRSERATLFLQGYPYALYACMHACMHLEIWSVLNKNLKFLGFGGSRSRFLGSSRSALRFRKVSRRSDAI